MLANDILRRNLKLRPNATAMRFAGREWTYRQLDERVNRLANALAGLGIGKGERVAMLAKNCNAYVELYFADGKLGAVTTPLNYRLGASELEYILNDSEAVALIVAGGYIETVESLRDRLTHVRHFISLEGQHRGYVDYESLLAAASASEPQGQVHEDDLLWQMYTSGTTGRPKGAMITHRNLTTNVMQVGLEFPINPGDRDLIVAPLYHAAAVINTTTMLAGGGTIVVYEDFVPDQVLRSFREDGINHALLVPAMILFLLNMPETAKADFGALRSIIYGASAIPLEVLRRAMETFRCRFLQAFGQTESVAVLTVLRPEDHVLDGSPAQLRRLQSCGREVFACDVRVVDEEGREVRPGEMGEVVARGANVMKGYWKLPEATASALRGGWLHTGDLGTIDEEGYIFIMDRLKDMIVSGGENIYPREIEEVLFAHPAVADAAVIGVPSSAWGEEVKAIVVMREGKQVTADDLIGHCAGRLAGYKKPRSVEFVAELPKNPSGKVLKRVLREPYWKGVDRRVN